MKIAITGATGFLGGWLCPLLAQGGHDLRALVRRSSARLEELDIQQIKGDLLDGAAVENLLRGRELLIHLAGRVSRDPLDGPALYELHVEGSRKLLRAAGVAKVGRVLLASTSGTIGVSRSAKVATEADDYPLEVVGRWPYYLSKIYQEKVALQLSHELGFELISLNPSLLLGPGDERFSSTGDIWKFLNRDIPAMPSGGLSFVDVRDVAQTFEAALTRGRSGQRYLLGAENFSFRDFFARLSRLTDIPPPRLRLPSRVNIWGTAGLERLAKLRGVAPTIDLPSVEMGEHFFYIDSKKAREELGFAPRDPQDTLRDTVRDLRSRLKPASMIGA